MDLLNTHHSYITIYWLFVVLIVINTHWSHCEQIVNQRNQTGFQCINGCPYSTECNHVTGYCECDNDHPLLILISLKRFCLAKRYIGEPCTYSLQCSHVDNAICVSKSWFDSANQEIKIQTSKTNKSQKSLRKEHGKCVCRPGFWANLNSQKCESFLLDNVECNDSNQCIDQNSHCDLDQRKCICDNGHYYHSRHGRCILNLKPPDMICNTHLDCLRKFNKPMLCQMNVCKCENRNQYDQECRDNFLCKEGETWDNFFKICKSDIEHNKYLRENREFKREWHNFTPKMIVFFLSVSIMIFMMKNRRSIFPPVSHLNLERNRSWNLFSGVSSFPPYDSRRTNYPEIVRIPSPTLPNAHNVHLRVNMRDEDQDKMVLPFRRMSISSDLSLTPNEQIHDALDIYHRPGTDSPPPSYDELPSYDEAIKYQVDRDLNGCQTIKNDENGASSSSPSSSKQS